MNKIETLYENAGVETYPYCCDGTHGKPTKRCKGCPDYREVYPPFTAEKQLELIKWLMKQEDFSWTITQQGKDTKYAFYVGYEYGSGYFKEFTEAIAGIINNLWQDLTEEERKQIKGILE